MRFLLIFCLLVVLCIHLPFSSCCIDRYETCGCEVTHKQHRKLECRNTNIASMFSDAEFSENTFFTVMILKNNDVKEISRSTFGFRPQTLNILGKVIKLDLSHNHMNRILPHSFEVLANLTRLNLSSNSIGRLSKEMFSGLSKLQVLDLSNNLFPILPGDLLEPLPQMKKLNVKSNNLVCNCLMNPFISWLKENSSLFIRIMGTCYLPSEVWNKALKTLNSQQLICDPNNTLKSLPYFRMMPVQSQLVFEGDEMNILCEGTDLTVSEAIWSFNDEEVDDKFPFVEHNTTHDYYRMTLTSILRIRSLTSKHSGTWSCTIRSEYGMQTTMIHILVVQNNASYCEQGTTENNKGKFSWADTVTGITTSLACPITSKETSDSSYALRHCEPPKNWTRGEYDMCPFEDSAAQLTNEVLQSPLTSRNVLVYAKDLIKQLQMIEILEPNSVELIARLLQKLITFMEYGTESREDDLGSQILELAGYVMAANRTVLWQSQKLTQACSKILGVIRSLAIQAAKAPAFNKHSSNIALSGNNITNRVHYAKQPTGMFCRVQSSSNTLKFTCDMASIQKGKEMPFIFLPSSLFDSINGKEKHGFRLYVIAYRNGALFQQSHSSSKANGSSELPSVTNSNSIVLEAGVNGHSITNLSSPVIFSFENHGQLSGVPVSWSPAQGWIPDENCYALHLNRPSNFTQVVCYKTTNITMLYDQDGIITKPKFSTFLNFVHPGIFAGTGILSLCLVTVLSSLMCCHRNISITSDTKHILMNICAHLILVAWAFTLGIWRVEHEVLCLASGISMHYASMSILLWITMSTRNVHQEMFMQSCPPADHKPSKPILRLYLIGCGIPIVICGITAAAKIQNYHGDGGKVCWLSWETSVFAFYVPAALTAIICVILLIQVLRSLNHIPASRMDSLRLRHSSYGEWRNGIPDNSSQRYASSHNQDINKELVPRGAESSTNCDAVSRSTVIDQAKPAIEQSFRSRLRGVSLLLFFFLASWVTAAIYVIVPNMQNTSNEHIYNHRDKNPLYSLTDFQIDQMYLGGHTSNAGRNSYLSNVLSCVYAFFTIAMGVFLVIQHLMCCNNIEQCWRTILFKCGKANKYKNDFKSNSAQSEGEEVEQRESLDSHHEKSYTNMQNGDHTSNDVYTSINNPRMLFEPGSVSEKTSLLRTSPECRNPKFPAFNSIISPQSNHKHRYHLHSKVSNRCHDINQPHFSTWNAYMMKLSDQLQCSNPIQASYCRYMKSSNPNRSRNGQDTSMTEHSFDEHACNNMHTVPIAMQHIHPKLNNPGSRYERMTKSLGHKHGRRGKLTVLREYAHDPPTSTEEKAEKISGFVPRSHRHYRDTGETDERENARKLTHYSSQTEEATADTEYPRNGTSAEKSAYGRRDLRRMMIQSQVRKDDGDGLLEHVREREDAQYEKYERSEKCEESVSETVEAEYKPTTTSHRSTASRSCSSRHNREQVVSNEESHDESAINEPCANCENTTSEIKPSDSTTWRNETSV